MKYCLAHLNDFDRALKKGRTLLAVDFDGTLCPIASHPCDARLSAAMVETLRRISQCSQVTLAVLSGRPLDDLRRRLPCRFICAGNHGLEIAGPGICFEHAGAVELRSNLNRLCEALSDAVRKWPGAVVEHKRLSATLHYRNADPRAHYGIRFEARRCASKFGRAFSMRSGLKALEFCPRVEWDKGAALEFLRQKLGHTGASICIGDDRTDETMFRANARGLNVHIGAGRPTSAEYFLWDPSETAIFLEHMVDVLYAGETEPGEAGVFSTAPYVEMA